MDKLNVFEMADVETNDIFIAVFYINNFIMWKSNFYTKIVVEIVYEKYFVNYIPKI